MSVNKSKSLPFPIGRKELVIMMASLMALNALAIDVMLPALGLISDDLGLTDPNERQWIVTSYIYGMAFGSIMYGSLADRYGRKPVLVVTISIYIAVGAICAFTDDFDLLLIARLIQGIAAAAMGVMANSIVRDRYEGDGMARMMSTIMMIFMIVPITAPILGQIILFFAEWHVIFLILSVFGLCLLVWVIFRLPETLHPDDVTPIKFDTVTSAWRAVIFHRNAFGHVLASGLMFAPLFAFIASAQQIFFDTFNAGDFFVYAFAINAASMSLGNFINTRIVMRFGARRVSQCALITFTTLSLVHLGLTLSGQITLTLFILLLAPTMAMIGLTAANLGSIAMQPFGKIAGVASSFQNFARSGVSASLGAAIGLQFDGTTKPLIIGFVVCAFASFFVILWAEKGQLFRRVQTAVTSEPVAANKSSG